jgi:hypothetical protein
MPIILRIIFAPFDFGFWAKKRMIIPIIHEPKIAIVMIL